MIRQIFTYSILSLTLCFAPMLASEAMARIELIEAQEQTPKISLEGRTLVITGAAGKILNVYDLVGNKLMTVHIDSNEKRVDLGQLGKGIYPAKIGNVTKKLQLR